VDLMEKSMDLVHRIETGNARRLGARSSRKQPDRRKSNRRTSNMFPWEIGLMNTKKRLLTWDQRRSGRKPGSKKIFLEHRLKRKADEVCPQRIETGGQPVKNGGSRDRERIGTSKKMKKWEMSFAERDTKM